MAYHIHRLRCFLALLRAMWAQAGADGHRADWQYGRDVARKRWERRRELERQLIKMRRLKP